MPSLTWPTLGKTALVLLCVEYIRRTIVELGPELVWEAAKQADLFWLMLCMLPLVGRFVVWAWKWWGMLAQWQLVPFPFVLRLIYAASFINLVTPTAKLGGGFLRGLVLHRRLGWRLSIGFGWVFADQVTNLLGNLLLMGGAMLTAGLFIPMEDFQNTLLFGGSLCFVLFAVCLLSRERLWRHLQTREPSELVRRWVAKWFSRLPANPTQKNERRFNVLCPLLGERERTSLLVDCCLSGLSFAFLCWSNALVLKALGATAPLASVTIVVLMGYLAGSFGVMGGVGLTEVFLIKLYTLAGVPGEIAAAGALLHRAVFYGFTLLMGGWAIWREGFLKKEAQCLKPETNPPFGPKP